ncbi:MAG: hypothetical protein JSR93_00610 [Verrucomicrobia bacterium]|nr:hypothetical protein [Verrucomicrobiota bacterium]
MSQISNADKQARFRKKEHLKRRATSIFHEWQFRPDYFKSKTPEDVKHSLDKAIDLPSGWTDKDYERAEQTLDQLRNDFLRGSDQLTIDIDDARQDLIPLDPAKLRENDIAIEKARALAAHMISALKISSCNDAEQAAALMEALRFVGRSLAIQSDIPRSQATAMSLASIGREYDRPEWFAAKLADTISAQAGNRLAREVGRHLIKS